MIMSSLDQLKVSIKRDQRYFLKKKKKAEMVD